MTLHEERLAVTDYALPADKVEAHLAYPGSRPEGSYITDGVDIQLLSNNFTDFEKQADELLAQAGLPLISERIPVLAYGANANPSKLVEKMAKFNPEAQAAMQLVPNCAVILPDTAAVWHGKPGQVGSYFAELYNGPEAQGSALQAHVGFLTLDQLGALDASEGVTYTKLELPAKVGLAEDDIVRPVIAYGALKSQILLDGEGKPITVAGLNHLNSDLSSMTAQEAVAYTLNAVAAETNLPSDEREFVLQGIGMKLLQEKKDRQKVVSDAMATKNMQRAFSAIEDSPEQAIGRVDIASLPGQDKHLHYIPQMVWSPEMARANSKRALAELSARTGLAIQKPQA